MKLSSLFAVLLLGTCVCATGVALAQTQDVREVSLMRRDFSDCANGDVNNRDTSLLGGTVTVARRPSGATHLTVSLTARPNTTYHFFLKCVRHLGDITTGADGVGGANFDFATSSAGDIFAFDMYPPGAPLGNKYQSVQVNFRDPPPPPPPPAATLLDSREVSLVRRDFSDCSNADVRDQDPLLIGGTAWIGRWSDGTTHVNMSLDARPSTTYHFFLKCVRHLGDITTGQDDGSTAASLRFRTAEVGDIFAFDMYPEGAPLGNKYQSVQVNFRDPPPSPVTTPSPRIEYLSQTAAAVTVGYADIPADVELVLINNTLGTEVPSVVALREGSASIDFALNPNLEGGRYYLQARKQADKSYIAQTIAFYVN